MQGFFITAKEMKPIGKLPKHFTAGTSGDCRCGGQCRQLAGVFALSRVYNALRFPESGTDLQPAPRSHHAGGHRHLEPCCRALGQPRRARRMMYVILVLPYKIIDVGLITQFYQGQYRIILSADTASEVRQLLSQKRR